MEVFIAALVISIICWQYIKREERLRREGKPPTEKWSDYYTTMDRP